MIEGFCLTAQVGAFSEARTAVKVECCAVTRCPWKASETSDGIFPDLLTTAAHLLNLPAIWVGFIIWSQDLVTFLQDDTVGGFN